MKNVRIAAREAATLLTREATDQVGGAMAPVATDGPYECKLDSSTDCWVTGGAMVSMDDAY